MALGGRSLVVAGERRGATRRCRSLLAFPLRVPAPLRALSPRATGAMAARRRPRGEVPECPPPTAPSTPLPSPPLPRLPQPPVASDPAAGSPRSSGARAPTSGDTRGPDPGDHPGAPATRRPRFPVPGRRPWAQGARWVGVGSPGTRTSSGRDDGRIAARALAHGHHHRQLLRRELLHHQQQLRLRPRVPPHRAGTPDCGRDRECRTGSGRGRQVDPASSRASSSAHRAGSGLPAGSGNALELSLDVFVKCKTHIHVLAPCTLLGTDGRDPQDVCCGRLPSLLFSFEDGGLSRELETQWAFIDLGCLGYLGPPSPDVHVHGSLKTKLFSN